MKIVPENGSSPRASRTSAATPSPGEQVLRRDIILARHLGDDRAGRIGFRHHSSLGLVTPATPTPRTHLDIDPATYPRSFNHMVNHICGSTSRMRATSCRSSRALQGGGGEPLTMHMAKSIVRFAAGVNPKSQGQ